MAIVKDYNRRVADAGVLDKLQLLTQASTGTRITNYGVTVIDSNSTAPDVYQMDAPRPGLRKTIVAVSGSTAGNITVNNASTSVTFLNSTNDGIAFTGGPSLLQSASLIGISTSQWAVISIDGGALA